MMREKGLRSWGVMVLVVVVRRFHVSYDVKLVAVERVDGSFVMGGGAVVVKVAADDIRYGESLFVSNNDNDGINDSSSLTLSLSCDSSFIVFSLGGESRTASSSSLSFISCGRMDPSHE
eukprot:7863210-Ditylum_brightwellii.AAC.1